MKTTLNNPIKKEIISLKKVKSDTEIKQRYFTSQHHDNQIKANASSIKQISLLEKKQKKYHQTFAQNKFLKESNLSEKHEFMNIQNTSKSDCNIRLPNKERLKKICLSSQRISLTDGESSTQQSSLQQMEYINEQYQLTTETSFKKVRFSQKLVERQPPRQSILQRKINKHIKIKSPSILKNSHSNLLNQSIYSETERSYSIQNSFQVRKKIKFSHSNITNSNKIVKQKYQKILASLFKEFNKQFNTDSNQKSKKIQFLCYSAKDCQNKDYQYVPQKLKFKDQLFPPVFSSLFRVVGNKKQQKKTKKIEWMRISELFKYRKCKVFNNCSQTYSQIIIYKSDYGYCSDIVVGCFNAIKNNRILLQTIFQKQEQLNPFGLYIVKICIGTAWKYILIDDFVPVIKNQANNQYQLAFLNIQLQYQEQNVQNPVYIWPILLQKAYASYYSCYEALKIGTETDFLAQITDSACQIIQLKNKQQLNTQQKRQIFEDIRLIIKQKNIVFIGYSDEDLPYVPLKFENYHNQTLQQQFLTYYDPLSNYLPFKIKLMELDKLFSSIYIYRVKEFQFKSTCLVYPPKILSSNQRKKLNQPKISKNHIKTNLKQIDSTYQVISIRSFTILSVANCSIIISQRQNRFYFAHKYIWNRVFIFGKQYNNSFRWIFGSYKNTKNITFKGVLNPGEYYIIVMPQWKQQHNRQITIIMHSDNQFIAFQRKIYNSKQRIIEQGCMDLAQREGKLIQINKFICSYNLLYEECGLIIENICNQRPKGEVTVMRSISGLKSKLQILPINNEFYIQLQKQVGSEKTQSLSYNEHEQKRSLSRSLYMKQEIEVQIPSLDNYTVVLKMKGGIDKRFFKAFKF